MRRVIFAVLAVLAPVSAFADELPAASDIKNCMEQQITANAPVAECVVLAQAECARYEGSAPAAATLCYINAKETWGQYIAAQMDVIRAAADETIAAVAGIEVKYDLLQNMLQCDRLEELTLLQGPTSDVTVLQRAKCEAVASGHTYIKLLLQSRNIE